MISLYVCPDDLSLHACRINLDVCVEKRDEFKAHAGPCEAEGTTLCRWECRERVYLPLIKQNQKKKKNPLCWFRQIGGRQRGFPWEISFLDRYGDRKFLPSQRTDHELLIKAADSAHIWPVSVGFTAIGTKHSKALRWHAVWKSWRGPALLCKPSVWTRQHADCCISQSRFMHSFIFCSSK